ncbi:G-type lectin S-receptor-like serine/threonine-protein kinase SD2-5 isoform X2 [Aristolochia californica]|uniref:G-type lectin S-receptor-like serine/threonine-protein kinase SD2-5 isoform X2 n=1 Tax=Aristolochia californica TaxID=171875 RepID=UPI0035D5D580
MGFCIFFLFFVWCTFFSDSRSEIMTGHMITLSIPTINEAGFHGRTVFMETRDKIPNFRASLGAEAVGGNYVCSLSVLLGEVEVWSSKQFSEFLLQGSCVLELTIDGVLQLRDSTGRIGWQTATVGEGVEKVKLLRTGNLVLTDARNQIKWQSFDFPGKIMLWQQRLAVPSQLTSVSTNSTLSFSFSIQYNKIVLYLNSANHKYTYWEYQTHKNRNISYSLLGSTGLKLFDRRHRKMAQIFVNKTGPVRFLALGKEGNLGFYHYSPHKGKFEPSFRAVNATCDLPLACGRYGLCTFSNTCRCLQFTHQSHSVTSNCHEGLTTGFCETEDSLRMVELVGIITVLEGTPQRANVTKEECSRLCMQDCSCAAALFSENRRAETRQGCFLYEFVVGLKQVVDRRNQFYFLVKIPDKIINGKHGSSSNAKKWLLVFGTLVDAVIILLIFAVFFWYCVFRKRKRPTQR